MLSRKIRYHKIIKANPELLDESASILEVGSGIEPYLSRKVTGLDIGSVGDIPFPDESFDYVLCVDGLEQLPEGERKPALLDLIRVARKKVLISQPGKEFAETGERYLKSVFNRLEIDTPDWLETPLRNGLPDVGGIVSVIVSEGYKFTITPNEGFLQHYSGVILDSIFPLARDVLEKIEIKAPLDTPIHENQWDLYYSFLITVLKDKIPAPIPRHRDDGEGVVGTAAIYAVYHKDLPTDHLDNVTPIYVGAAADSVAPSRLTDRLRGERSLDNGRWSELSAIYRIWREGPRTDVVGFCHYRRLFQSDASVRETRIHRSDIENYRIDEDMFGRLPRDFIIAPQKLLMRYPVFKHYCLMHNANHICAMYDLLEKARPDLLPYVAEQIQDHSFFANNMFMTSWANFDELCQLWFGVLTTLEAQITDNNGSRYQRRDLAFLAERLFDIWMRQKIAGGTKLFETGVYFLTFENLDVSEWTPAH